MKKFILALDQGTTSSRSILFDQQGQIHAIAQQEFTQHFPNDGWVEHDANEIWLSQLNTIREVLANSSVSLKDVVAIGITNQRETIVCWDRKTLDPVHRAIVWQDRRTAALCEQFKTQGLEEFVKERTGLRLDPYFSGTKIKWILDQHPNLRSRAERGELAVGTIDSWLIAKLTLGQSHVTDASNASRTLLFNLKTQQWDADLLKALTVPASMLPSVVPSQLAIGDAPVAQIDGESIPITGIAGDQQSALFGQQCFKPGMAKNTYGTGCFLLMNTGSTPFPSHHGLLTTLAWKRAQTDYALEGSVFCAGSLVQWLRDGLQIISSASEVEALAQSVSGCEGVQIVPAFTGLGAPYWDPYARGTITGLTRHSHRGHIARAALEAIALQSAEVLLLMEQDTGVKLAELRVDGGACKNNLLMQLQADILGVPVVRPRVIETTAFGAAALAGLGAQFWENTDAIKRQVETERVFEPSQSEDWRHERLARWKHAVTRALSNSSQ
jgi:glycerol kinase